MENQSKKIFIITGASRGLGQALAEKLAGTGTTLVLIGRREPKELIGELKKLSDNVYFVACDLALPEQLDTAMENVFSAFSIGSAQSVILINNAGVISPIGLAGSLPARDAIEHLNVNALAPIALTNSFIRLTQDFQGTKAVLNISSGAAKRPIEGWSLYCSAKAALEMFTECVAKEQAGIQSGVQIFAMDPGAIDTGMQEKIRAADPKDFPPVARFIEWHRSGGLKSPERSAEEIIQFLDHKLSVQK